VTTPTRGTVLAALGLAVLLIGWIGWARRVHGVGLPYLAILVASSLLLLAGVLSARGTNGAAIAVVAAMAFLAAAVDPGTGYDERNGYCFLVGTVFVVVAAARAYPTPRRLEELDAGTRGERALAATAWTSSMLLVAAVVTFISVTALALWALSGTE
jgi:hypothetical protein